MAEANFRCDCHLKHSEILDDHKQDFKQNAEDHKDFQNMFKGYVSIKIFSLFVLLFFGNLGFQIAIYDKINDIDKKTAVIEEKINHHIDVTNGKERAKWIPQPSGL